ncbi:hypothetical protein FPHYL_5385 [Fusarium phyllophilum]|uniref:Uncharacterized protein n=1 Tax=Fusarium phyllophilum TaxID=47803 RepID=A0A8H5NFU5_9HYPO|nr:hypothetical protein FPHYL_5385 [Fusarium phyllophilum]
MSEAPSQSNPVQPSQESSVQSSARPWDFSGGIPLELGAGLPNLTSTPLQAPLKTLTPNWLEVASPEPAKDWFGLDSSQDLQGRVLFHLIRPNCSPPQHPIPLLPLVRPLQSFITPTLALKTLSFTSTTLSLVILLHSSEGARRPRE